MNKFLLAILSTSLLFGAEKSSISIVNYNPAYKDALMSIAFENPEKFLAGYSIITRTDLPAAMFEAQAKIEIAALFDKEENHTRVLLMNDTVIGFIEFHKTREICVEDMKQQFLSMGMPAFSDEQLLLWYPHVKKTIEECTEYIDLECLAVSRDFRSKGYGRMLLNYAVETAQEMFPEIKQIRLNVNTINEEAIKLYESAGFIKSPVQPAQFVAMEAIQYEKELN
jgi:ribosomal protein S18 acetylase RimI-like enzyme